MADLVKIKEPVAREMAHYEEYIKRELHSDHQLVSTMLDYVLSTRGKAIRPLLALLSASLLKKDEELSESSYLSSLLVEMIHTASLVHDDVIDEAYVRRGKPSVNALWRSHRSVLIGDYILARSFSIGMESGEYEIVRYICGVMSSVCEGELIQSDQSDHLSMTRDIYLDIIHKKTATLIGRSCGAGAMSVKASHNEVGRLEEYGDCLGMAFQIKDDILDYTDSDKTGKPSCNDLIERKITLPMLTVLESSDASQKEHIINLLSDVRSKPENIELLRTIVETSGGIEKATAIMNDYISRAKSILHDFSDSPYRDSLLMLCDFVAERES